MMTAAATGTADVSAGVVADRMAQLSTANGAPIVAVPAPVPTPMYGPTWMTGTNGTQAAPSAGSGAPAWIPAAAVAAPVLPPTAAAPARPVAHFRTVDLLSRRHAVPPVPVPPPQPPLQPDMQKMNCLPWVMRPTIGCVPKSASLLAKSRLPFGLHVHPFADMTASEMPVVAATCIVRCQSCRAYINPFVKFVDGGQHWQCNVCFLRNKLPPNFDQYTHDRQLRDRRARPELSHGNVEYMAPPEYMVRPPQPPTNLFVVDVSAPAVRSGMVRCVFETVLRSLEHVRGGRRRRIGFITFDSTVHFYNLKATLAQSQMLVVPDLDDVLLPSPDDLLVVMESSIALVRSLLERLATGKVFASSSDQSALGPALLAAKKLMGAIGGRILLFQYSRPSVGVGQYELRDDAPLRGTSKEFELLQPAMDFYKTLAMDVVREQIAVDMFFACDGYADLATLSCLARHSGGSVFYYPSFNEDRSPALAARFRRELSHVLRRNVGFESVLRIRCTKGVSISTYHGHFFIRSSDLLSLPVLSPDMCVGAALAATAVAVAPPVA